MDKCPGCNEELTVIMVVTPVNLFDTYHYNTTTKKYEYNEHLDTEDIKGLSSVILCSNCDHELNNFKPFIEEKV